MLVSKTKDFKIPEDIQGIGDEKEEKSKVRKSAELRAFETKSTEVIQEEVKEPVPDHKAKTVVYEGALEIKIIEGVTIEGKAKETVPYSTPPVQKHGTQPEKPKPILPPARAELQTSDSIPISIPGESSTVPLNSTGVDPT